MNVVARFRDLPIRYKLTTANVVTTAVALLLASVAFLAYEVVVFRERLIRHVGAQAEIVGSNSAAAVLFKDRAAAEKTLAALRAETQVVAAGIYLPDGTVFATYTHHQGANIPEIALPTQGDGFRFVNRHLLVHRNIIVDGEEVGSVRMVSDLTELVASVRRYALIALAVFAIAIAVSIPLLTYLQRLFLEPIMGLVRVARQVSEDKNFGVRATVMGDDELGLLVRTFNEMLAQIQARDTEIAGARDAAESANRAKDEFLAVVSHELRTPLSPILAWTRMLRDAEVAPERMSHGLDVIDRNVRSQAQLIEDLLDVSRIISGKLRLDVRPIELAPVVEAAVESVRPTADVKQVRIQVVLDPRSITVSGDAERLKQVVWNLLSNAIKFTPRGGRVQVVMQCINSHVEIAVSDTGKGVNPEFLPYVFERFRQADSSSTRTFGGLGLGLSIVRNLVELHGGQVRAESLGEGKGATFRVELPLAVLHAPAAVERVHPRLSKAGVPQTRSAALQGLRILVADDDVDTLETIRILLTDNGATVRSVTSAGEALALLREWLPDLLISDIGMPEQDGYWLIRQVRGLDAAQGGRIPAIALTAYARVEDRLKVLSEGFQLHVAKPIEPAELIAVVGSIADWAPKGSVQPERVSHG
jgi:signal transduction histidine kinase/CheY-like chemotaxis protein